MKPPNPSDDVRDRGALAAVVRRGADAEAAMKVLFDAYQPRFRRLFLGANIASDDAKDLTQEVFLRVFSAADRFKGDSTVRTWMMAIALNLMRDHHRRVNPEITLDEQDWATHVLERPADNDAHCDLESREAVLACFETGFAQFKVDHPKAAQAIELAALMQVNRDDMARLLNRSPGALREFLSQSRKKFKPYIERCHKLLKDLS